MRERPEAVSGIRRRIQIERDVRAARRCRVVVQAVQAIVHAGCTIWYGIAAYDNTVTSLRGGGHVPPTELGRCTWRARCRRDRAGPEDSRSLRSHRRAARRRGQLIFQAVQVEVRPRSTRLTATCEDERTSGGEAGREVEKIGNVEKVVLGQVIEEASFRHPLEQT